MRAMRADHRGITPRLVQGLGLGQGQGLAQGQGLGQGPGTSLSPNPSSHRPDHHHNDDAHDEMAMMMGTWSSEKHPFLDDMGFAKSTNSSSRGPRSTKDDVHLDLDNLLPSTAAGTKGGNFRHQVIKSMCISCNTHISCQHTHILSTHTCLINTHTPSQHTHT